MVGERRQLGGRGLRSRALVGALNTDTEIRQRWCAVSRDLWNVAGGQPRCHSRLPHQCSGGEAVGRDKHRDLPGTSGAYPLPADRVDPIAFLFSHRCRASTLATATTGEGYAQSGPSSLGAKRLLLFDAQISHCRFPAGCKETHCQEDALHHSISTTLPALLGASFGASANP